MMPNYRVYVTERTVLHIEADNPDRAREKAAEDYIWGPDQLSPDYYDAWLDIEEDNDG